MEKRSLLNRLLFPLHLKLPIEFVGVAATVVLVIFIFIPQLEKNNYSESKPVATDNMQQEPASSQDEAAGQLVTDGIVTKETVEMERVWSVKKEVSVNNDEQKVAPFKQLPKSSVPGASKPSPIIATEDKKVDMVESGSAAEPLSENVTAPVSAPAAVSEPARQFIQENSATGMSPQAAPAMPAASQEQEFRSSYNKNEEQTSESKRKIAPFEKRRMKSRSANSEQSYVEEMASAKDVETGAVPEEIIVLLAKCTMKWTVKGSRGDASFYSASGTPAAVTSFLREIAKRPDITLLKVVPENYSAALDSVIVEFSVKERGE